MSDFIYRLALENFCKYKTGKQQKTMKTTPVHKETT